MAASEAPRSIWNGTVRFRTVFVPVGLTPARRSGAIEWRTLHRECGAPVEQKRWCSAHEREVAGEECVRGFEVADGQFVTVEEAELEATVPDDDRSIDVFALVEPQQLPSLVTEASYYLAPSSAALGRRAYVLMAGALATAGSVALARMVFRGHEWLVAITADAGRQPLFLLRRLCFADELVDDRVIGRQLAKVEVTDEQQQLAVDVLGDMRTRRLKPADLLSNQRARVRELLDAKIAAGEIVEPQPLATNGREPAAVSGDLEAQLRASIRPARAKPKRRTGAAAGERQQRLPLSG